MFVFSLFIGCSSVCKSPINELYTTDSLYATCTIPSPEESKTVIECLSGITNDTIENRSQIYQQCQLSEYVTENEFIFAKEDMVKATYALLYLQTEKIEDASTLLKKIVKESNYPIDLPYVQLPAGQSPIVPAAARFAQKLPEIEGVGLGGDYELWGAPQPLDSTWLLLDDVMTFSSIRHHLSRKDIDKLHFVYQDKVLHYVTLNQSSNQESSDIFWQDGKLSEISQDATRLKLHVSSTIKLMDVLPALSNLKQEIELDISSHPCVPLDNMECFEGNRTHPTYYLDVATIKNECIEPAICSDSKGTWLHANQTCRSQGKRLPTLKEAKDSGRTEVFWTNEWSQIDQNDQIVCADRYPCTVRNAKKWLSDGSASVPEKKLSGNVICALDYPATYATKTTPPFTFALTNKVMPPLKPEPELAKIASSTIRNDNLDDKGICGEDVREQWIDKLKNAGGGRSTMECRDPFSYVTPNEPMRYIWSQYFNNIGGGYAGVGSDQNYDFITVAKSEWAWLYDYDPNVYRLHQILKPMILQAETAEAFLALFEDANIESTSNIIRDYYKDLPSIEQQKLLRFFTGYRKKLHYHYKVSKKTIKEMPSFGWLTNPDNYAYIRTMHQQDRIIPVAGDMLADNGLRSIGDAAKAMGITIRIFYTSNAPTAWGGQITDSYKKNVNNFPFDRQSLVLTTFNRGGFDQTGYWHHNIANGILMQYRIGSGYYTNYNLNWDRVPTSHGDMTSTGLLTTIFEE